MNIIKVNVYYNNRETLFESFSVSADIYNLDDARMLVLDHLSSFYSDVKYKLNLKKSFNGEIVINLDLDESLGLSREVKLRKIFSND